MDRQQKLNQVLARVEHRRQHAMNELDAIARRTNSFGSKEHRSGRDKVDRDFEQESSRCERLEDNALDLELAKVP
jgi:hypothetical protein